MKQNMKKEQIEKAAKAYTQEIIDSNSFEVNYEEDNYDAGSLHATSEVCPMAFIAGADWRINSVWHPNTEMPKDEIDEYGYGKDCLVKPKYGVIEIGEVMFDDDAYFFSCNRETYSMDEIDRWAYVEDLLPTKKCTQMTDITNKQEQLYKQVRADYDKLHNK